MNAPSYIDLVTPSTSSTVISGTLFIPDLIISASYITSASYTSSYSYVTTSSWASASFASVSASYASSSAFNVSSSWSSASLVSKSSSFASSSISSSYAVTASYVANSSGTQVSCSWSSQSLSSSVLSNNIANIDNSTINFDVNNTKTNTYGGGATILGLSVIEGTNCTASGITSHAEGLDTIASGNQSHAEGNRSEANGNVSHADGYHTVANGYASHTAGAESIANNDFTYVWSDGTTFSDTATQQFNVYATNGINLLGGPISGSAVNFPFAIVGESQGQFAFADATNSTSVGCVGSGSGYGTPNNYFFIYSDQAGDIFHLTLDTARMGLGTDTPNNKLDVIGNISCSVVTASLNGTASWASASISSSYAVSASYAPVPISSSWSSASLVSISSSFSSASISSRSSSYAPNLYTPDITDAYGSIDLNANIALNGNTSYSQKGVSYSHGFIFNNGQGQYWSVVCGGDNRFYFGSSPNDSTWTDQFIFDLSGVMHATASYASTASVIVGGSIINSSSVQTGNYTLTSTDYVIIMSGSNLTCSLPPATSNAGRTYNIKNIASSSVYITGSNNIDGGTSAVISAQWTNAELYATNGQWYLL